MRDWLSPLLMMFYAPSRGMSEVRDRAPLGAAALLALLAQGLYAFFMQWLLMRSMLDAAQATTIFFGILLGSASALLPIALVFVPLVILFANLFERRASFGLALQQEYGATTSVIFYAWAATNLIALPLAYLIARASGIDAMSQALQTVAELQKDMPPAGPSPDELQILSEAGRGLFLLGFLPMALFAGWGWVAVRQVFRFSWLRAAAVLLLAGAVSLPLAVVLLMAFGWVFASPFLLILLFIILRGYFTDVSRTQRARAAFKQNLEAATLNPADASAHYNLGLIHLHRKELDEARARFERAVEIDAEEVDSHFQLGRIARAQGRLSDAIQNYGEVVARDDSHAQHEIWREIGATYIAAGQFADAQEPLERFLARRQSDPEALYLMGRALFGMGRKREALEYMQRCIEAVKTAPAYKYRVEKRWLNEAQQFLRSQA